MVSSRRENPLESGMFLFVRGDTEDHSNNTGQLQNYTERIAFLFQRNWTKKDEDKKSETDENDDKCKDKRLVPVHLSESTVRPVPDSGLGTFRQMFRTSGVQLDEWKKLLPVSPIPSRLQLNSLQGDTIHCLDLFWRHFAAA
ncbi:hypothetical protein CBL_04751 [Carabus blaptoides fortunei]